MKSQNAVKRPITHFPCLTQLHSCTLRLQTKSWLLQRRETGLLMQKLKSFTFLDRLVPLRLPLFLWMMWSTMFYRMPRNWRELCRLCFWYKDTCMSLVIPDFFPQNKDQMMRAVQFASLGDASVLKLVQVAKPVISPNQILVKNHASGVNFIDTYHRTGLYKVPLPYIPGR